MQAESELSDKAKREELDAVIRQARVMLLKAMTLPTTLEDNDPKLDDLTPPWKEQIRIKSKELLIDEEVRRRKSVISYLAQLLHFNLTPFVLGLSR